MAEVFGRLCGDPSTYIPRFARACTNDDFGFQSPGSGLAACSLVEIVARCGGDLLSSQLHSDLTDKARRVLQLDVVFSRPHHIPHHVKVGLRILSVLGKNMDNRCGLVKVLLQKLSDAELWEELMHDADAELWEELIQHATVVLQEFE